VSGWLRLYRGDVAGALERFMAAGPYAGDRSDATQRTMLLAVLQPIEVDTVPELGHALLKVAQGDTSAALDAFEKAASELPAARGGAELRLYAGHIAVAARRRKDAEQFFRAAAVAEAPGTAPAAELALGELLMEEGRHAEAMRILEHLILTYPQSALVAQARRKLDEARGAAPKT
jgi:predicted Zn-dependent protease